MLWRDLARLWREPPGGTLSVLIQLKPAFAEIRALRGGCLVRLSDMAPPREAFRLGRR